MGKSGWIASLCLSALLGLGVEKSASQDYASTLDRIAQTGSITIGFREEASPFSFRTSNGEAAGFSIDLCAKVVDAIKAHLKLDTLAVRYVSSTTATRFILIKSGQVDLECAATTNTAERRKLVDFSYPHFVTATQFVSRQADQIETLADLSGHSVASTSGTINIDQINALNRAQNLNIAVIPTKTHKEGFEMVANGRVSAFVMDGVLLAAMIADADNPNLYTLSSQALSPPEPYGLMMRHGDTAFKTVVNAALRQVFTSGDINTLYDRWFASPIPPKNVSLNLPMSTALQKAFAQPVEFTD